MRIYNLNKSELETEIINHLVSNYEKIRAEYESCPAHLIYDYIHTRHKIFPSHNDWKTIGVLHKKHPEWQLKTESQFKSLSTLFTNPRICRIAFSVTHPGLTIPYHQDSINKRTKRIYFVIRSEDNNMLKVNIFWDKHRIELKEKDIILFDPGRQYHSSYNRGSSIRSVLNIDFIDNEF